MSEPSTILELQENAGVLKFVFASGITLLNAVSAGTCFGYQTTAAVTYPVPNATTLVEPMNESQLSWFMSIIAIAMIVSVLISGLVSETLGRKKALALAQLVVFGGWVVIYFATTYEILLFARCVMGVGIGISFPTTAMYLSEISLIRHRGIISTMNTVVMNTSVVASLMLAFVMSFQNFILVSALPPVIFIVTLVFLWESPFWLVKKGRIEDAENALLALRGPQYAMNLELEEMKTILANQQGNDATLADNLKELRSRAVFMPVLVVALMICFQPLSGCEMVIFYSLDLFRRAKIEMNQYMLSMLAQGGISIGYIIGPTLMNRVSRKVHYIVAGTFMVFNLVAAAFIIHLESQNGEDEIITALTQYVMPTCIILVGFGYGIGVGPVPFALMGEILPQKIKNFACGLCLAARNVTTFFNLKNFPILVSSYGLQSAFAFYASVLTFNCIIAYFIVPETRGKSLTELSLIFEKKETQKRVHRKSV